MSSQFAFRKARPAASRGSISLMATDSTSPSPTLHSSFIEDQERDGRPLVRPWTRTTSGHPCTRVVRLSVHGRGRPQGIHWAAATRSVAGARALGRLRMAIGKGSPTGRLTGREARTIIEKGVPASLFEGKRVLVLTPDATRTAPLPMMVRLVNEWVGPRAEALDFLVAPGPPKTPPR